MKAFVKDLADYVSPQLREELKSLTKKRSSVQFTVEREGIYRELLYLVRDAIKEKETPPDSITKELRTLSNKYYESIRKGIESRATRDRLISIEILHSSETHITLIATSDTGSHTAILGYVTKNLVQDTTAKRVLVRQVNELFATHISDDQIRNTYLLAREYSGRRSSRNTTSLGNLQQITLQEAYEISSKFTGNSIRFLASVSFSSTMYNRQIRNRAESALTSWGMSHSAEELADAGGPSSMNSFILNTILSKAKSRGAKVTIEGNAAAMAPGKASLRRTSKVAVPRKPRVLKYSIGDLAGLDIALPEGISAMALRNFLNLRLRPAVVELMGTPRLNYQSGRLATSFRVTQVNKARDGTYNIGYTYMKNPYSVFDKKTGRLPWNSPPTRDPYDLGGDAIKNLMREAAIQRFYLRRE